MCPKLSIPQCKGPWECDDNVNGTTGEGWNTITHEIAFCELFIKFIFLHEHMHLHKEATKVYAILWCNIGGEHELLELLELLHKGKGL
jgi:hypothetical protein